MAEYLKKANVILLNQKPKKCARDLYFLRILSRPDRVDRGSIHLLKLDTRSTVFRAGL